MRKSQMNNLSKVTRLEIIDHTPCNECGGDGHINGAYCTTCDGSGMPGRDLVFWDAYKQLELSLQDDGKTLKIFIESRDD